MKETDDTGRRADPAQRRARGIEAYARIFDVPENEVPENDVPENDVPENDVPENDVPENDVPENDVPAAMAGRVGPVFAEEAFMSAGGPAWSRPAFAGSGSPSSRYGVTP